MSDRTEKNFFFNVFSSLCIPNFLVNVVSIIKEELGITNAIGLS